MESANTHHHPEDHQLVTSSSSSSCYGVGTTATNAWTTPISILNTNGLSSYPTLENNLSSQYASMAPDSSNFHWLASNNTTLSGQDLQIYSRIKEQQLSNHFYRGYTELLTSNPPQNDLNTRLLLKSLSSGNLTNKINQLSTGDLYSGSQIFPSINISNLNQPGEGLTNPAGSLDMNLEALDLLTCSRFSGNFGQNQSGIFRDGVSYGSFDQIPLYGSNKVTGSSNGVVVEAKRTSSKMEPKAPLQNAPKKSRLEARASCPPFKVRKEKLGDRIAALQQLVAPFGKTDTASVLMDAIGYIKFLQSHVETLSVPYMKASRNKSTTRVLKGGPTHDHETEESKRDLKSRGLCLVPLPCLSYITDGGGGAVWPPPHFGGAPQ